MLSVFMMVSIAEANNGITTNSEMGYTSFYKAKPIKFVEKGVIFYVYPNGEFKFKLNGRTVHSWDYAYRRGYYTRGNSHVRLPITHDRFGKIKRVRNVFIDYNRYGNVTRIGSVFIDYHRRKMVRIGGLHLSYNSYGDIRYFGRVKPRFSHRTYRYDHFYSGMILDYDDDYFYYNDFYNDFDTYREDDHYYYYRSKRDKDSKKRKIIKRKKQNKEILDTRKRRS